MLRDVSEATNESSEAMARAMPEATEATAVAPWLFGAPGGPDPVEAGRRGGRASARARRESPIRELEQRVAATRNG
jgi:hypothetical protein